MFRLDPVLHAPQLIPNVLHAQVLQYVQHAIKGTSLVQPLMEP
jgi:hypothetical protein